MNGLHDVGGMHGFGPVVPEPEQLRFHTEWHKRALALTLAMGASGKWSLDESRFARESLTPAEMITLSYYERWVAAMTALALRYGLVTEEELRSGRPDPASPQETPALPAERVAEVLRRGAPVERKIDREPRFKPGDRVRARNINPPTHTRLPRYARGKVGEIVRYHGAHIFADVNAHQKGAAAEPLYAVRFTASELWGPQGDPRQSVTIDLWEPHLEPAA
jgi:nitrile hydratase